MKPKGYIDTEARVKEMFANRARVKAKQEWATIMENVDIEMRRRRYCNPGIQCHVSGTMEHCDNPSTLTPQGGSSLCSTGDVRSQATSARILKKNSLAKTGICHSIDFDNSRRFYKSNFLI